MVKRRFGAFFLFFGAACSNIIAKRIRVIMIRRFVMPDWLAKFLAIAFAISIFSWVRSWFK